MDIEVTVSIPAETATSTTFVLDLFVEVEIVPEVDPLVAAGLVPAELVW